MSFQLEKKDFTAFSFIRNKNKVWYSKRIKNYKKSDYVKKLHSKIDPVRDKFKELKNSIQNDLRFSNFEVDISSVRPNGYRFNGSFWLWMVDLKKFQKMKRIGIARPQVNLPQIQISINPYRFVTAELWFEPKAFKKDREKIYKFFDINMQSLKDTYNLFINRQINGKDEYLDSDIIGFDKVKNNLLNKKYNEAGIYNIIDKEHAINLKDGLVDKIKNDLFNLLDEIYEPLYGKILDKKLSGILNDKKLRNEDDVYRKGTEGTQYERKHFKMQNRFKDYYIKQGFLVHIEKSRIDAIKSKDNVIEIVEMKPYYSVMKTIREALGQIIAYGYLNYSKNEELRFTIAGLGKPTNKDLIYINYLKSKIKFHFQYLQFDYNQKNINPKYY